MLFRSSHDKSIFINGYAGTGKTTMIKCIIEKLNEKQKKYLALSPTNKGARLIGGQTIHKFYYKFKNNAKSLTELLKLNDYLFIDEVSMMYEKFYQLFITIKKSLPHLKIILSGDFNQLPPVCDKWKNGNGDYENSAGLFELCEGNKLLLTKCRRANDRLFKMCLEPNKININNFKSKGLTMINLAFTHKTRIEVNDICMKAYIKETNPSKTLEINFDENYEHSQNIILCKGMPVVCYETNKNLDILNSQKFSVKSFDKENIIIIDDDEERKIEIKDFHKYFYLGFCITIHASQGETYNEPYTIHDWGHYHISKKARYVALSRATNEEFIQIKY